MQQNVDIQVKGFSETLKNMKAESMFLIKLLILEQNVISMMEKR